MAISVILATAGGGGAATVTLTGAAANDLVVVASATVGGNTYAVTTAGYTTVATVDDAGTKMRLAAKRMGGSPDASVDIGSTAGGYAVYILRGVDTTTFEDAAAVTGGGLGAAYNSDAITTVTDLAWVLTMVATNNSVTDQSGAPSGYGNYLFGDFSSPNVTGVTTAWKEKTPAGSEDPGVFAGSPSAGAALTATWAVRPAAASVGTVALTGAITSSANETTIRTGGATIILTLTGDTWVAAGAAFDAQRQAIINGIDSAQAEAAGWDATVKALQSVAGVVRTSNTVVTITLDAQAGYQITAQETITATVPSAATTLNGGAIVASPTFTVATITESTGGAKNMLLMGVG